MEKTRGVRDPPFAASTIVGIYGHDTNKNSFDTNKVSPDTNKETWIEMPLTDVKVRTLKTKSKPYKVSDSEGLHVLVSHSGAKLWRWSYRSHGKQLTLSLGRYPMVSLLDARRARDDAKRLLFQGTDPSEQRRAARLQAITAAKNTFEEVANEWFRLNESRWVRSYSSRLRSRLDKDLLKALGKRPISSIEPSEILHEIRKIERRDAIEMAKRIMQMASAIFCYGVATARCRQDPTVSLKGALKPNKPPRRRQGIPERDLPDFLARLERYDGDKVTRIAMKLIILTFVRTAELRFARWSEFEGLEGQKPIWRIPASRMKMRRDHLVPLPPQAVRQLNELRKLNRQSEFLFPAPSRSGVMSENTLLFALYRMGYHGRATVHGFRSTASTILNENNFNRDWIEIQLAHCEKGVRGIYNAAEWMPGRRRMLCWWANFLDKSKRTEVLAEPVPK